MRFHEFLSSDLKPVQFFQSSCSGWSQISWSTQELQRQTQNLMRRSLDLEEELEDLELKHQADVMVMAGAERWPLPKLC